MRTRDKHWHMYNGFTPKMAADVLSVPVDDVRALIRQRWFRMDGDEPEVLNLTPGAVNPRWSISGKGLRRYADHLKDKELRFNTTEMRRAVRLKWDQGVYVLRSEEGPRRYKIGHTVNLEGRMSTLRTMSPVQVRVVAFITGAPIRMEQRIHRVLASYRLHGEWFAESPALLWLCDKHAYTEAT